MIISYCSQGGNTHSVAQYIKTKLPHSEVDTSNDTYFDFHDTVVLGAYTWGNGKIPKGFKEHVIKNGDNLKGKKVFIFGTGNSIYPSFCGAVDGLRKICSDLGAEVIEVIKIEMSIRNQEHVVDEFVERIKQYS